MQYRVMTLDEADRIQEIDAMCFIKYAWRFVDGERCLVEINWTDYGLPNGYAWHLEHLKDTLQGGGCAIGCFHADKLVGYGTLNAALFGKKSDYALLDQLFVSKPNRGKGIGKRIFALLCDTARALGAQKIYVCAGSSEDTIAFYRSLGFCDAVEINQALLEEDPNDYQMELVLRTEERHDFYNEV